MIVTSSKAALTGNKIKMYSAIFASLTFSIALIIFRVLFTGTLTFAFLGWNLILAFIPFVISSIIFTTTNTKLFSFFGIALFTVWLLFFPNAPYIITDLFHLKARAEIPIWYDTILIFSAAWNGLVLAFMSLFDMEKLIKKNFNSFWTNAIVVLLLAMSSFGVYLGRYLRWNSWDMFSKPFDLLSESLLIIATPMANLRAYGLTITLTAFMFFGYQTVKFLMREK